MVSLQGLHVLDLKAVNEQVIQSDDGKGVLDFEPADEGLDDNDNDGELDWKSHLDEVSSLL